MPKCREYTHLSIFCNYSPQKVIQYTELINLTYFMKKYIFVSIFLFVFFIVSLSPAHAAALTNAQVQAILSILSSFGADTTAIANVRTALTGGMQSSLSSTSSSTVSVRNYIGGSIYSIGDIVIWRNTVNRVPRNSRLCTVLIRSSDNHEFAFPSERSCQSIPITNGNIDAIGTLMSSGGYDLTAGQYRLESRILSPSSDTGDGTLLAKYISDPFVLVGQTTTSANASNNASTTTNNTREDSVSLVSTTAVQNSATTTPPAINSFSVATSPVFRGTSPRLAWVVTPVHGITGTVCNMIGNRNESTSVRMSGPGPSSSSWVGNPIYEGQTYTLTCITNTSGTTDLEKGVATKSLYVPVSTTTSVSSVTSTQTVTTVSPSTTSASISSSSNTSSVSPFRSVVVMSHSISGAGSANPLNENVEISALQNARVPIDISGWKLTSGSTDATSYIPKGTEIPTSGVISALDDIILTPGTRAIIISGRSPIGASFRENKCIGYFKTFQSFSPQLPQNCPTPPGELTSFYGPNIIRDTACIEYIDKISQCQAVLTPPDNLSSACQLVTQYLNYSGCVNAHKNDADFLGNTWRVYLGRTSSMWRTKYEIVKLLDTNGKIIDTFNY